MTGFDIVVLLIAGAGAITGFARGFIEEILGLMAWIFALFAIRTLHMPLTSLVDPHVDGDWAAAILAFALLLLVPYVFVKLVVKWIGRKSRASVLGPIDRLLGLGFGVVKGVIIVVLGFSVLVLIYDTIWGPGGRPDWIKQARSYPFINASSEALVTLIAERRREAIEAERQAQGG
ncbi:MAG: CvpA family protein [Novosphingobium sp.]|nr:CvpA family protein [Novosphingobium sp.]